MQEVLATPRLLLNVRRGKYEGDSATLLLQMGSASGLYLAWLHSIRQARDMKDVSTICLARPASLS